MGIQNNPYYQNFDTGTHMTALGVKTQLARQV
jgi:hypothetical protein